MEERVFEFIRDNWYQFMIILSLVLYLLFKADSEMSRIIITSVISFLAGENTSSDKE